MRYRPLACIAAAYLAAQYIGFTASHPAFWLGAALLLLAGALFYKGKRELWRKHLFVLLSASVLFAVGMNQLCRQFYFDQLSGYGDKQAQLTGHYAETQNPGSEGTVSAILRVETVNGKRLLFPAKVQSASLPAEEAGAAFCGNFAIDLPQEDEFSRYRLSKGILTSAWPAGQIETSPSTSFFQGGLQRFRLRAADKLHELIGGQPGAICTAMLLGDKGALSDDVQSVFRKSGVSHLLVVSGLHLSVLASAVILLLRRLRIGMRLRSLLSVICVVVMMAFFGFTPSVTRAGVMLIVALLAPFFGRESDPATSLGAAVLLILLAKPYAAVDAGLLLSAASVGGLLYCARWAEHFRAQTAGEGGHSFVRWVMPLLPSACAAAATLPVLAVFGGGASLFSPLANLLCVPLTLPTMLLSFCTLLLSLLPFSFPSVFAAFLARASAQLLHTIATAFASLPFGYVFLRGAFPLFLTALLVFLFWIGRRRWKRTVLAGVLAGTFFLGAAVSVAFSQNTVCLASVGKGGSVIAQKGDVTVVFYTGTSRQIDDVEYYLEQRNLSGVDLVVNLGNPQIELALQERLRAEQIVSVRDTEKASTFPLNNDILVVTQPQKKGWAAGLISPQGRAVCYSGTVDLSVFGETDILFCTKKPPANARARLFVGRYEEGFPPGADKRFLSAKTPAVCLGVGDQLICYEES